MTHVPTTTLGDGLAVSALGYGAMGLSEVYGPAERSDNSADPDWVSDTREDRA